MVTEGGRGDVGVSPGVNWVPPETVEVTGEGETRVGVGGRVTGVGKEVPET